MARGTIAAKRRLHRERTCEHCGETFPAQRASARFCSNRCKLSAARGAGEADVERDAAILALRRRRLIGKVWPVYTWDTSPAVFALLVPTNHAAQAASEELGSEVTDAEMTAMLKAATIVGYSDKVEPKLIAQFRALRRDRRATAEDRLACQKSRVPTHGKQVRILTPQLAKKPNDFKGGKSPNPAVEQNPAQPMSPAKFTRRSVEAA